MIQTKSRNSPATPLRTAKPYKGPAMEGLIARWYARIRRPDADQDKLVRRVRELVGPGAKILG